MTPEKVLLSLYSKVNKDAIAKKAAH
jgi:hypothetical protein